MAKDMQVIPGAMTLAEMREFAGFGSATQRYIRRSLDVGLDRGDAVGTWGRDAVEEAGIKEQAKLYMRLADIRKAIPEDCAIDSIENFMPALISLSAYDLGEGRINGFPAYRFLYERLLGPDIRPWLPASFCAAASLPHLHPKIRKTLLQSISEAAATAPGWSTRAPSFFPEWVEKVETGNAAH
ncbi:hypothetical protein [Parasphingorhabdus sp.]|uniref:hypothetical protein n=1 Tax=Parasphingorhabdus sp. TaxID=2709688 RepID=UPI002F93C189